ncbi:MAG: ATP-binding protein [Bacteroidota bacterium]|nr:ATP-binding protein [Bacteroidota bacterium]
MKKLSLIGLILSIATACHKAPSPHTDQWTDYSKGYQFLNTNKDSAFYYFNKGATNSGDREAVALCYRLMASIQSDAGDNYGAQESLIQSLKSLDEYKPADQDYLATDDDELGLTYSNLENPDQAIVYYRLALHFVKDTETASYFFNHLGNAYQDKKDFSQALINYNSALKLCGKNSSARARILTNIAVTKWMWDDRYDPSTEIRNALVIRIRDTDLWGETSGYGHLADFYSHTKPDSARVYAERMLHLSERLKSGDEQLLALKHLIPLSDFTNARFYFQTYQRLNDSVQRKRNVAKNQFALIRYNVEKAKAENLQLQKKNNERRYQLLVVTLVALAGAFLGLWLYKRRKRRMQLENDRRLQESKLKLSQKVHDKVANGIYRIMSEVEHLPELDRAVLLDQLENMYNVSRNLAHDEAESADDFAERISTMLYAFKKPSLRLAVTGNEKVLWQAVSLSIREELMLVLQELMVNMSKHSKATQAFVGFTVEDGRLILAYRDDGIGLSRKETAGKGLQSTVSRIEALNGTISFDGVESNGLRVLIQLPIFH